MKKLDKCTKCSVKIDKFSEIEHPNEEELK